MISNRCISIINHILDEDSLITIKKLAQELIVSERTVRYDLDKIDEMLLKNHLSLLIRKPYITFVNEDRSIFLNLISKEINKNEPIASCYYTHDQRVDIIILSLLFAKDYTTIDSLCQQLVVSRSTIRNDLEDVKEWFSQRKLFLESKSNWGLKILDNELLIRRTTAEFLTLNIDDPRLVPVKNVNINSKNNSFIKGRIKELFSCIDVHFLEDCVSSIENQLGIILSDESYMNLILYLSVMLLREKNGKKIPESYIDMKKITLTLEYAASANVIGMIEANYSIDLGFNEITYFTVYILGSGFIKNKYVEHEDWYKIQIITGNLIENVSEELNLNLFLDKQLYDGLLAHIGPSIYRIKNELPLKNPMLDEVKTNLSSLYNIVKKNSYIIENYTCKRISDEELGYITMHFGASLERMEQNVLCRINAIVVCNAGIGTANILSTKLKNMFQINIVDVIAYHQLKKTVETNDIDLIITTININDADLNVDVVKVSPLLNEKDIRELRNHIKMSYKPGIKLKNIVSIIKKSCRVIDPSQLYMDLTKYFAPDDALLKGGEPKLLSELLKGNTIELNVDVKDWSDAITKGGQLLYNAGCIDKCYIQAMIKAVKELGPYIVIAPGIALPHARPESGSKKVGMSLITLNKAVNFGNKENDPVSIVICLSAIDNSSHLKALSEVVGILEDEKNIELIKNSVNKDVILDLVKSYE